MKDLRRLCLTKNPSTCYAGLHLMCSVNIYMVFCTKGAKLEPLFTSSVPISSVEVQAAEDILDLSSIMSCWQKIYYCLETMKLFIDAPPVLSFKTNGKTTLHLTLGNNDQAIETTRALFHFPEISEDICTHSQGHTVNFGLRGCDSVNFSM
jgi:hypothetical protein